MDITNMLTNMDNPKKLPAVWWGLDVSDPNNDDDPVGHVTFEFFGNETGVSSPKNSERLMKNIPSKSLALASTNRRKVYSSIRDCWLKFPMSLKSITITRQCLTSQCIVVY